MPKPLLKKKVQKTVQKPSIRQHAKTAPSRHKGHNLRAFKMGEGLPNLTKLQAELEDMTDVLMGRVEPPIDHGTLTLMECADGYFARASEITGIIQRLEREGRVEAGRGDKGDPLHKFRTGELRTFMEMAKRAADLGSRRLTEEQLMYEMSQTGRESRGE